MVTGSTYTERASSKTSRAGVPYDMTTYDEIVVAVLRNPPDPNEPLPLSNRTETIYGPTITFLILSWIAVISRLWVRFKVVREPGWDDLFVFLAAILNTATTIFLCLSVRYGLGKHMLYIGQYNFQQYLHMYYFERNIYLTETPLIKISLLLQYLRIFRAGYMRRICIVLIILVALWGIGFAIVGWFPCFPIHAAWRRNKTAKCYGFGFGDARSFAAMYTAHSASNMTFDIAIFLTPLVLFRTPNLKRKSIIAMAGVFTFGAVVVATSVWRLYTIVETQASTYPYMDFTWWTPTMVILSTLEMDLAIICASIPVFWPIVERSLAAIFVTYELDMIEEQTIDDHGLAYQLEHMSSRNESINSSGGSSTQELTKDKESDDSYVVKEYTVGVDPLSNECRYGNIKTNIKSKPKPNWKL